LSHDRHGTPYATFGNIEEFMNLASSLMGLPLAHPFVAGASPLGRDLDTVKRLEDGGAAAIVLPSLFEEQITLAAEGRIRHRDPLDPQWAASLIHFPDVREYAFTPQEYAEHVARVRRAVGIPVIGSLNGTTAESWLTFSRLIEQAGASALELNMYEVVADSTVSGAAIEHDLVALVHDLKQYLKIPIAVKMSPFFASIANVARQLDHAGADALVLFNRFYQPDIDIATMAVSSHVQLSTSSELLLRLRWLAILHGRVQPSLVATGGVATPDDGIKAILAGADAVQVVSAVLRNGPGYFSTMRAGLEAWMKEHDIPHVDAMRGRASLESAEDPSAFERGEYIRMLHSWHAAGRRVAP
jgi:dihydroorotate dehydrogenase (fumarate)